MENMNKGRSLAKVEDHKWILKSKMQRIKCKD